MDTITYNVTLRFQFPAYDERDGVPFDGIIAATKSEAIKKARREAAHRGYLGEVGKGRATFKAEPATKAL